MRRSLLQAAKNGHIGGSSLGLHYDETCQDEIDRLENRQSLIDSRQFATESRWLSWWHLATTLILVVSLLSIIYVYDGFWLQLACSWLLGLTAVRVFILYHDYMHGAIFRGSLVAHAILMTCGHLLLTPPTVWRRSHDHHHHHNSKLHGTSIGSFPVMTRDRYQGSTWSERVAYRISRSPFLIFFSYATVFLYGMCIGPFLNSPRKNWSAAVSVIVHFGTMGLLYYNFGLETVLFAFVIPAFIAMLIGAYLFYIQHNFPESFMHTHKDWTYADAAMNSSSFLESGPLLGWFLGNIGYHHVHHLNSKIPFYRLPEAMAALPKLQNPGKTSFAVRDIYACLRLKLWDPELKKLVPF